MKRSPLPPRKEPIRRTGLKTNRIAPQNGIISRSGLICRAENGCQVLGVHHKAPIRPGALKPRKKKPLRFGGAPQNPEYLVFIRECPCILSHLHKCSGRVEAAHTGRRGYRQKAQDESALPMCCSHHRTGKESHHVLGRHFWGHFGLDREKVVEIYNAWARMEGIRVPEIVL